MSTVPSNNYSNHGETSFSYFTGAFPFITTSLADPCHLAALRTISTTTWRITAFHANERHVILFLLPYLQPASKFIIRDLYRRLRRVLGGHFDRESEHPPL